MSSMTATPISVVELKRPERPIMVGGHEIPVHRRTVVMGILNVTPDSFSDGGRYVDLDRAVAHARQMVADGADIIDIGGESTRPGHKPVPVEEELKRVIPVIERVSREVNVPMSIDTYKAETARQALKAGAHIVNDVWGFKRDPDMARVVAEFGVPAILMHNREQATYDSLLDDIVADLQESIQIGRAQGVREEQIILDPGIGFAKTYEENLTVMRHLETVTSLGYPVLLGTSRKSMIGKTLDLPVNERVEGTAATVALGIAKGCSIIRVHDVQPMVRVARMMDAMLYGPDALRG